MSKPRKKKTLLFVLEILILVLFIGALYLYGQLDKKIEIIEQPVLNEEKVVVNAEAPVMTGYSTYALFGIDHRDKNAALGAENSDTIIIASVNNDTKDVKLVSVYRDTLLNLGNGTYSKANAAYAYGGAEQAISMLNRNLDLNITDYATVDFNALTTVIDLLGGLELPLSYAEIVHMNNYCKETAEETGKSYTPIPELETPPEDQEAVYGVYQLNGVQATSYCRIRYTASLDMGRTERQRKVIQLIVQKAKKAGLSTIFQIMDQVFPMVTTSMQKTNILQMIPTVIGYSIDDTTGFPMNYKFSNVKGSVIVPTSLETNVIELHKFLYGEDVQYTPSSDVLEASSKILAIVGGEEQLDDVQVIVPETENTTDESVLWQENADGSWTDTSDSYTDSGTTDPGYTDPGYTDQGTTDPGYTDPGTSDPGYTDPGTSDPGYTDPGTTDPGYTDPGTSDPGYTDPGTSDPGTTDPGYTDPGTGDTGTSGGSDVVDPGVSGEGDMVESGAGGTETIVEPTVEATSESVSESTADPAAVPAEAIAEVPTE